MSYDQERDLVVDAFRLLFQQNRNADFSGWGPTYPAIASTRCAPINASALSTERLPVLAVYRTRTRATYVGKQLLRTTSFRIDYVGPQTPIGKLETRFPILRAVADSMFGDLDGLLDSDGFAILESVGGIEIVIDTWDVRFFYYAAGSDAYPAFYATFDMTHYPEQQVRDEAKDLPLLLELFAKILPASFPDAEQPMLEVAADTEQGAAARRASDDPYSDDHDEAFP